MKILIILILFLLSSRPRPQIQGATTISSPTPIPIPPVPSSPSSAPSVIPSPIQIPTPPAELDPAPQGTPAPVGISESSLWDALIVYRASHNRTSVIREESLCSYARKRVSEHSGRTDLDNHAGFQRDADNGSLFSDTGDSFTEIGEVLAYLPNVQNATQVIEWGWDSSPAHREGLLSNDSTHACIVGTPPFYVGILGKK